VLTAYSNNTQNDNDRFKKAPFMCAAKVSKEKRKETEVNQIESPMEKERKKNRKEKTIMGM